MDNKEFLLVKTVELEKVEYIKEVNTKKTNKNETILGIENNILTKQKELDELNSEVHSVPTFLPSAIVVDDGKNEMQSNTTSVISSGFQNGPSELNFTNVEVITRQALGRIAALGELYDAHKDSFCGHSLFCNSVDENVKVVDTEKTETEYFFEDSINTKFQKFEIEAELKASFLSGMLEASGHGKYLSLSSSNGRESSASLVCRMSTKHESINISNRSLIKDLSLDAIKNCPYATHVVTAIQWGAGATAELSYKHADSENKEEIKASLRFAFERLVAAVKGKGHGENIDNSSKSYTNYKLKFYVDALPNGEKIPQTVEEALKFMEKLPKLIENANKGKGVPMAYTLLPLSSFKTYLKQMEFYDRIIHKIDENIIEEIVQVFDEISKSQAVITSIYTDFTEYSYCLKDEILQNVNQKLQDLRNVQNDLRKDLYGMLVEVRYGRKNTSGLIEVLQKYQNGDLVPKKIDLYCNTLLSCKEKVACAQKLKDLNVIYVGRGTSLEIEQLKHNLTEYYGYFCDWSDEKNRSANFNFFISFATDNIKQMFIDMEVNPVIRSNVNIPDGNRICHYLNGKWIDIDMIQKWIEQQSKCLVKCKQQREYSQEKPNKRVDLDLPCPQSFKGKYCPKDEECEWYCNDCSHRIQYGFNENFYCKCGFAPMDTFEYKCCHERHGGSYVSFEIQQLKILIDKIRPYKEINILLLGETGVGKSTWINSFANYLTYESLTEAEKSVPICLIPSQFIVTDENFEEKTVTIGVSENENFTVGESCTRQPLSHVFNIGKKIIRIIDTPGIGDTRGVIADKQKFSSILQYISNHSELHGICILLKPNNPKLNLIFKYCINELLAHLHKAAASNIVFCFTHARSTNYKIGNTFSILKKFVDDLYKEKEIRIDLGQETIYHLDNEAFRFLCLTKAGESFGDDEHFNFEKSWEISRKETQRLLNHFENDVKPHVVDATITLNEARRIILNLIKPIADISKNIQQNIQLISTQKEKISQLDENDAKLREKLRIPNIGIKVEPLGHARTVCRSEKCCVSMNLENTNINQIIYKTICHEHCYLRDVTPENVPNPEIQNCWAMKGLPRDVPFKYDGRESYTRKPYRFGNREIFFSPPAYTADVKAYQKKGKEEQSLNCRQCGCHWDSHLHITFNQELTIGTRDDEIIKSSIAANQSAKDLQQQAIKDIEDKIEKYQNVQEQIDKIVAKFSSFLKKNAIFAYNDTLEDYLKLNIQDEEQQSQKINNQALIEQMKEQLERYREEKQILDKRLQTGEAEEIQPQEIKVMQKELEELPLIGAEIKLLFDATVKGQQNNYAYTEQYFEPEMKSF